MSKPAFFGLAALILILDQWSKMLIARDMLPGSSVTLVPHIFYLTHTTNTGAAFGVFPGATHILALTALVAVIGISVYAVRRSWPLHPIMAIALALPLGGAAGNFLDRARLGYVVDFLDVWLGKYEWPVFNVADSAICIGVVLLAILSFKGKPIQTAE